MVNEFYKDKETEVIRLYQKKDIFEPEGEKDIVLSAPTS